MAHSGDVTRAGEESFSFTLNGRRIEPPIVSMNGTPDRPAAGDLIELLGIPMVLDGPGEYRFQAELDSDGDFHGDGAIRRTLEDGTEGVVGIVVDDDEGESTVETFTQLSAESLKALRGVSLATWGDGIERVLACLDPERVAIQVSGFTHREGALPPLPERLRHLAIISNSFIDGFTDLGGLGGLKGLRSLDLSIPHLPSFDLAILRDATALRHLEIVGSRLNGMEMLAKLPDLRSLQLLHYDDLRDIEFIGGVKTLVRIDLRYSGVKDLSPLQTVTTLVSVLANGCPVERLPSGPMPALRELGVMSTKLTEDLVAAFRKTNPGCVVAHRWNSALRAALEGCDRLRLRTGGTCHRNPLEEKILLEVSGKDEVAAIAAPIAIDETSGGGGCLCCGDPTLEFYQGPRLAVMLGLHHGNSFRWQGRGSGPMTPDCRSTLLGWLVRSLYAVTRDACFPQEIRLAALTEFATLTESGSGKVLAWRIGLAESLLEKECDPAVRRAALDLLRISSHEPVDAPLKHRSFDLLGQVARRDASADVRSAAVVTILRFDEPRGVSEVAEILRGEKEAGVRAALFKDGHWPMSGLWREPPHTALHLAARAFHEDPNDQVKRAAMGAFLDVLSQTFHRSGTSVDPRTTESIGAVETALQQMQFSRETKDFIQKKLEAADVAPYARLKRALEGRPLEKLEE